MSSDQTALLPSGSPRQLLADLPLRARAAMVKRLDTLVATITGAPAVSPEEATLIVEREVGHAPDLLWLAYSVLCARLPSDEELAEALVLARLYGTWAALVPPLSSLNRADQHRNVEVVTGAVTCDVHATSQSPYTSGIQRVVRATASRWHRDHEVTFLGWTKGGSSLRRLDATEHARLFGETGPPDPAGQTTAVVPWECTHLSVEVLTDLSKTGRLLAMGQHSRNELGVLGYDSIPITSSTTVAAGMASHFARWVAAVRRADRVAMISPAAAEEFRGVLSMGAGRRDDGPEVVSVPLAVEASSPSEADLDEARAGLVIPGLPMLLVVGSHEPRKNHLAALHAAELLWRDGLQFNLVLVGAGSWNADLYAAGVAELLAAGRPVQSIRALPDRLLWAAYRLARCTVFPSLNEGYGLPVAESLAAGTPVVTSRFGSMRDVVAPDGEPLGGLLIDPHDDADLTSALRAVLNDELLYERLRSEAARHRHRTWDEYAEQVWNFLVEGEPPPERAAPSRGSHR